MKTTARSSAQIVYLPGAQASASRDGSPESDAERARDTDASPRLTRILDQTRPLALAALYAVVSLLALLVQVPMLGSLPVAYRSTPFAIAALVAVATLVMLLARLREFDAERRARELQRKVDARTRELSQRTDELLEAVRQKAALINELRHSSEVYEREAHEDPLTGLPNRRHFDAVAADWFASCRRTRRPISAALIDLDHFKRVNDRCSHAAGDAVLRRLADLIREQCSEVAICARYGGEEFALLFPNCSAVSAARFCEGLRVSFERSDLDAFQPGLRVTLSAGVADDPEAESHQRLLSLADNKLYRAKRAGRNRVHS
jgi:diguanylate cyclase (GGDEF)-like protein